MKKNDSNFEKLKKFFSKGRIISTVIFLLLVTFLVSTSYKNFFFKESENHYVPYKEFSAMVKSGEVEYVFLNPSNRSSIQFLPTAEYLKKNKIIMDSQYTQLKETLNNSKEVTIDGKILPSSGKLKFYTENPNTPEFKNDLLLKGIRTFTIKPMSGIMYFLLNLLQLFLPFLMIMAFLLVYQKRMEPSENELITTVPDTKFDSIAGYEGLKSDSKFILDFLKNPKAYEEIGARLPNGVLFYGPPGTGKTLMARAIAGEAKVPFFKVNGSDFIELYVGLGARRVRKLYKTARQNSPCIVFIDEIDSIGGSRGDHRGSSEDDKTLTALLNELDGFSSKEGVITIAATNRLQDLDPALVRPGRFDRQVAVPLPNKEERLQILKMYAETKKLDPNISIEALSEKTIDFSPSELENLLNEAAILAVTRGKDVIYQKDIDDSFLKIIIKGDKKEDKYQSDEEKRIIAYHESGHAIVNYSLGRPVLEVSIIGTTSGAGGYTLSQPKEGLKSKADMKNQIKILYAGRAAETIIAKDEDDITIGAVSDIHEATKIISDYTKVWGLNGSLINMETFGVTRPDSELVKEANELANKLFEETVNILKTNRSKLDKLANTLLEKSMIDHDSFIALMKETEEVKETSSEDFQA